MKTSPETCNDSSVSVLIPTYNGLPFLSEAIESVRRQSHVDWELIICDNCSTDGTAAWLKTEQEKNPDQRMRLVSYDTHLPMVPNWNRSLAHASYPLIKILPADDVLLPDCLKTQVELLKSNPDVGFVTSSKEVIDASGLILFRKRGVPEGKYDWHTLSRQVLLTSSNALGEPGGVLFRAELLDLCGDFDSRFRYYLDVDLLLRFMRRAKVYVSDSPLYQFRVHGSSQSANSREIAIAEYLDLLKKYEDDLHLAQRPWFRVYLMIKATVITRTRGLIFEVAELVQQMRKWLSPLNGR